MNYATALRLTMVGFLLLLGATPPAHSHYLFAWTMETRDPLSGWYSPGKMGRDALAVFDVSSPGSADFGKLVAFLPVGNGAKAAHHTNYSLPPNNVLYANDWKADRTYVFDLNDPRHPKLVRHFANVGKYSYPHTFVYLPNGDTLATFQYAGGFNKGTGGLVEFDSHGHVVKTSSAADARIDPNIRPYSIAVSEKLDRIVTSSGDMEGAQHSHVAQVWRLSDLKLIKTMPLPQAAGYYVDPPTDSSEPRTLDDGKTIVVPTFKCGLFLVEGLAGANPSLRHVYDFGGRSCEVPVVAGRYLVIAAESMHELVSLDMSDSARPRMAAQLLRSSNEYPHWIALEPNGDRLVIAGLGALATHLRFATIDRANGKLSMDAETIDLDRTWPDGWKGPAIPHGTVFANQ